MNSTHGKGWGSGFLKRFNRIKVLIVYGNTALVFDIQLIFVLALNCLIWGAFF